MPGFSRAGRRRITSGASATRGQFAKGRSVTLQRNFQSPLTTNNRNSSFSKLFISDVIDRISALQIASSHRYLRNRSSARCGAPVIPERYGRDAARRPISKEISRRVIYTNPSGLVRTDRTSPVHALSVRRSACYMVASSGGPESDRGGDLHYQPAWPG